MGKISIPPDNNNVAAHGIDHGVITAVRTQVAWAAEEMAYLENKHDWVSASGEKSRPHMARALEQINSLHKASAPPAYRNLKVFKAWDKYLSQDTKKFEKHWAKITPKGVIPPLEVTVPDYLYYYGLDDLENIGVFILILLDRAFKTDTLSSEDGDALVYSVKVMIQFMSADLFGVFRGMKRDMLVFQAAGQSAFASSGDQRSFGILGTMIYGYAGYKVGAWIENRVKNHRKPPVEYEQDRNLNPTTFGVKAELLFLLAEMTPTKVQNWVNSYRTKRFHENLRKITDLKVRELSLRAESKGKLGDSKAASSINKVVSDQKALVSRAFK